MNIQVYKIIILFSSLFAMSRVNAQTWTQKADFSGTGRYFASGFVIDKRCYIGLGTDSELNDKTDFWEYNIENNSWIQKTDLLVPLTERSIGLSISNKGYIATDQSGNFWEFDPLTDTWTQKANYPGAIVGATSFSIGMKGYIATGSYSCSLWEWDGDTASPTYNIWTQKASFPPPAGRY